MDIVFLCEESQVCTLQFRIRGHNAFSCDLLDCSGGFPQWHIKGDALKVMRSRRWDMIISFPPCTDLAVSGARWFKEKRESGSQQRAISFFMEIANYCEINNIPSGIENPVGIMSSLYRRPDQIIQPWQFGHGETKATCLWLNRLPKLFPTEIVGGRDQRIWKMKPSPDRAKMRSKTFTGIAAAMAAQWSSLNL